MSQCSSSQEGTARRIRELLAGIMPAEVHVVSLYAMRNCLITVLVGPLLMQISRLQPSGCRVRALPAARDTTA